MGHAEFLRSESPDSQLARQLGDNYRNAGLSPKQVAMLEFAEFLTVDPANVKAELVEELREAGWADEDIVDIVHITALYNYMVRIADGLGVELETGWQSLADKLSFRDQTAPKSFGKIAATPVGQTRPAAG